MATKAKLTLSQLLFRRTSSSNGSGNNCTTSSDNATNNNNTFTNNNNVGSTNCAKVKHDQFSNVSAVGLGNPPQNKMKNNSFPSRKVSTSVGSLSSTSGGRQGLHEFTSPPERRRQKGAETQQQLHGILKKPPRNDGEFAFSAGKPTRSSLHRSRSNPNPSNNPLKEVSWSCPTLEKRREVILNYFERIILENKQEQTGNGKVMKNKPNIPCEGNNSDACHAPISSGGEPIYEEISDCSNHSVRFSNPSQQNNTGSLKPKVLPKKVRMNIPQDHNRSSSGTSSSGDSPIYDRVLCRSNSMIEPLSSSSASSTASSYSGYGYYDVTPPATTQISASQGYYENFENLRPYSAAELEYGGGRAMVTRMPGRSHSFHDNYRPTYNSRESYNVHGGNNGAGESEGCRVVDTDQLYAKVCKRKKMKPSPDQPQQLPAPPPAFADSDTLSVQVSCGNVVTMIPIIMPCSSSFSTSCLSLSSSSDNNTDDSNMIIPTITSTGAAMVPGMRSDHQYNNDSNGLLHYEAEKILPDKDISYVNNHHHNNNHLNCTRREQDNSRSCCGASSAATRNRNNLSVIHLLAAYNPAKEIEEFIPATPTPSFTAIIDSTECAPKSISVPVRVDFNNSKNTNRGPSESSPLQFEDHEHDNEDVKREEPSYQFSPASHQPLIVTNCNYCFKHDDEDDDVDKTKLCSESSSTSVDSSDDDDDDGKNGAKYSFTSGRCVSRFKKTIKFQDDPTTAKDLLLLTTSESEDEEGLCEHKSLIEMNTTEDILDESSTLERNDKYMSMMDDEDRGFDSFLDDNDTGSDDKGDQSFRSENLRSQRTFAQTQQNVSKDALKLKAANVLDLINSEISDLHMRELELKKLHGSSPTPPNSTPKPTKNLNEDENTPEESEDSGEDDFSDSAIEYDGFGTNGSQSSGQVSPSENLNESHPDDRQAKSPSKIDESKTTANTSDYDSPTRPGDIKVRPIMDEEDKSIKFSVTGETPIEREIRLTREREEEFRTQVRSKSSAPSGDTDTPAPKTTSLPATITAASIRPEKVNKPEMSTKSPTQSQETKDLQYEMATARFKREIEEGMQREKELLIETRKKTSEQDLEETNTTSTPETIATPPTQEEGKKDDEKNDDDQQDDKQPEQPVLENALRKPTLAKLPINKLPAARFFAPPAFNANKPNRITPVVSPIIISRGSLGYPSTAKGGPPVVGGSLPPTPGISRPSFTSFEKYILQASMNYNRVPTVTATINEEQPPSKAPLEPVKVLDDPLRFVQKTNSVDEDENEQEKEVEDKPKRRYIPAQDKIHKEIEELAMREKELTHTRAKWKSTLDLPEALNDTETEEQMTQSTLSLHTSESTTVPLNEELHSDKKPSRTDSVDDDELDLKKVQEDVRQVTRIRAPARRRHSLLINQWEERIRQQQQLNSKK